MDRTKSRALCNPPSSAPSSATVALNIYPGPSCPRGAGCTRSFQFARVVHSTGDRKILGEENSFSSTSLSSSPYYPIFFFRRLPSKAHRCAGSLHYATFRSLYPHEIHVQWGVKIVLSVHALKKLIACVRSSRTLLLHCMFSHCTVYYSS